VIKASKMATNLQLDDEMINKAVNLGKHKSKKEAVNQALKTYVQSLEQEKILSLFGTVEYDPDYDYKKQRNKQ
jgi:Arc/MetJ family transcription regulator